MSGRTTWIGLLWRRRGDVATPIVEALETKGGNLRRAAAFLGITDRQLQRYLWRERLWGEVDRTRREARARRLKEVSPV